MQHLLNQALAAWSAAIDPGNAGHHAGFIDEYELFWIQQIYPKAVIIGLVVGFGIGVLIAPLEMFVLFGRSLNGTSLHIASLFFGSLATLFGAYLVAHNTPTDKFIIALAFCVVNQLLGLLSLFIVNTPVWHGFVVAILIFAASISGWYLEKLTRRL
jgi:hypothetical protein